MPSFVDRPQAIVEAPDSTPNRRASLKKLEPNIDKVMLGSLLFGTWYYSPYPENVVPVKPVPDSRNGVMVNGTGHTSGAITCPRLYVCPLCFRYSNKETDYAQHLLHHQEQQRQGAEVLPVPETAFRVYEWDGYAVWEVDGEKEKLYCQNLSLFGKLFLEQKSVFFDTGSFKYYVLTHTPVESSPASKGRGMKGSVSVFDESLFKTKVLGFFSKENMSWDSNNLACILVFPPFQHRQLGQLLMAISYKLSGWEWEGGVIGGPEKPLSDMGRRSYLRFWSERVARFFMGQTEDAEQQTVFQKTRRTKSGLAKEEMTIKEIGERTGMLAEDVVAALNEMGICEVMPQKRKKKNSSEVNGATIQQEDETMLATMEIRRAAVLAWAQRNAIDIVSAVKEEGFLGEWALSEVEDEEQDEDKLEDGKT